MSETTALFIAIVTVVFLVLASGIFSWVNSRKIGAVEKSCEGNAKEIERVCSTLGDVDKLRIDLAKVSSALEYFNKELERGHQNFSELYTKIESLVKDIGSVSERIGSLETNRKNRQRA